jgi:hypothetical protein
LCLEKEFIITGILPRLSDNDLSNTVYAPLKHTQAKILKIIIIIFCIVEKKCNTIYACRCCKKYVTFMPHWRKKSTHFCDVNNAKQFSRLHSSHHSYVFGENSS